MMMDSAANAALQDPVNAVEMAGLDARLATVWQLLETIPDPEIPVLSIRELGILRDVRQAEDGVFEVVVTPTYSGCPAIGQIEDDIRAALSAAKLSARVVTQLAPAWTTDWMDLSAQNKLRNYGISPPIRLNNNQNIVQFSHKKIANNLNNSRQNSQIYQNSVPCPQCKSLNTTETSHFASTACKALYRCLDCLEPFDYFKPY